MWTPEWEIGAPSGRHCSSIDCDYDPRHDEPNPASWTLLNPVDGGDPLYYCDECKNKLSSAQ